MPERDPATSGIPITGQLHEGGHNARERGRETGSGYHYPVVRFFLLEEQDELFEIAVSGKNLQLEAHSLFREQLCPRLHRLRVRLRADQKEDIFHGSASMNFRPMSRLNHPPSKRILSAAWYAFIAAAPRLSPRPTAVKHRPPPMRTVPSETRQVEA